MFFTGGDIDRMTIDRKKVASLEKNTDKEMEMYFTTDVSFSENFYEKYFFSNKVVFSSLKM